MKVVLIGHDFDLSAQDGISRYSFEVCKGIEKGAVVKTIEVGKIPRPLRTLYNIRVNDVDIVHLMYPDVAKVNTSTARMIMTWHDNRLFTKYSKGTQSKYKPKLIERFGIASYIIRNWVIENYARSSAIICNSTQTLSELKDYFSSLGMYDARKLYCVIPLAVDARFLKVRVWRGKRRDLGYIGAVHLKHKNVSGLLTAFDKIAGRHRIRLHIFTSSPHAGEILKSSIANFPNLSSSNVVLHHKAPDSEVLRYLPKLVAYLHLTKEEGLGMPILESIASGTNAVILSDARIPEEVRRHAIKVSEKNVAARVSELIARPRAAPNEAVAYARSFTWSRLVKETFKVYKKVLANRK